MKKNETNGQQASLDALSALLGELIAKRWIKHHADQPIDLSANQNTTIGKLETKNDHAHDTKTKSLEKRGTPS